MRTTTVIGIVLGTLLLSGTAAALESRKGLELEGRFGPNVCVNKGGEECGEGSELKPGFGGGGYIGLRPLSFLSLGLDFGVYSLTLKPNESDMRVRTSQAMIDIRLYIPFDVIEPFFKLGVGYLSFSRTDDDINGEKFRSMSYSWGNFKFGGGLTIYLIDSQKIGNIGLGADVDFAMIKPTRSKVCWDDSCETEDFPDTLEVPNAMQFNLHFKWIFPIF